MAPSSQQLDHNSEGVPRLLLQLEPWYRTFLGNLAHHLAYRRPPPLPLRSSPAAFWPDVFVERRIPLVPFQQSLLCHIFVLVAIWGFTQTLVKRSRMVPQDITRSKISYFEVTEYLPTISTGGSPAKVGPKGEPAYAKQPIISVPELSDNRTQTIINPNAPKLLASGAKLPNLVAWTNVPAPSPSAATRSASQLQLPADAVTVVQPAPDAAQHKITELRLPKLDAAVVEPAPTHAAQRKLGDLNVDYFEAQLLAPKLAVAEQRSAAGSAADIANVPPPPPGAVAGGSRQAIGQLIALGLDPVAPAGPIEVPQGSRRGTFAATPEGKAGAPGTPDVQGGEKGDGATGNAGSGRAAGTGAGDIPRGIFVGGGPGPSASVPGKTPPGGGTPNTTALIAASAPHPDIPRSSQPGGIVARPERGKIEDQVFGTKRYYSLVLNMPNLTSVGGSWIIRFAELNENRAPGELVGPVATHKVDPAYPAEMMRARVEGTVTLYAVIRSDGSVGEIRVLRGLDERLDENAKVALSRWQFRPAMKNGTAVDLEAVVQIPFAASKLPF
ncbi:MAG TPA: TonB family protein [Terriglobales bacterium]|nr:TonB family protein [Terriglobales bacterium]